MSSNPATVNELMALLAKLGAREDAIRHELEERLAEVQRQRTAVQTTLDLLLQETPAPTLNFEVHAPAAASPPASPAADLARQLRGLTQIEALRRIADENEGVVRVGDVRRLFIAAGLSKSKPKNLGPHIYHLLGGLEEFEKIEPGVYKRVQAKDRTENPVTSLSLPLADVWR